MVSFKQAVDGELCLIREFAQNEFNEYNFAQMLPKLYGDNAKSEPLHTLLYDNNELKGMFALQIKDFNIADVHTRVGWIGTVCVKKDARGNGYLAQLMALANELLEQNKCDIGVLGGQRQRYKRFGYDYGGSHWIFSFTQRNLRDINFHNISLLPLNNHSKWLDNAYDLYCCDCINGVRTKEEFCAILSSWKSQPYVIVNDNTFTGYCSLQCCETHGQVYELRIIDSTLTLSVCKAILNQCQQNEINIIQCLWADPKVTAMLSQECESARLVENHSYKVLNWQQIILSGLRLKAKCGFKMQAGTMKISIQNSGIYSISILPSLEISIETSDAIDNADMCLTEEQAILTILGHTNAGQGEGLAGWFPLPFGFSWLDGI